MPTLNQRLGSFPTESRAAIFPQCRQDYPLPPPINRGGFQGLKEEKIGSKVSQKISIFSVSATFSQSFYLSLSLRRGLRSPPFLPPLFHHRLHYQRLLELLTNRPPSNHHDSLSLFSFQPFSLLCKLFSFSSISRIRPPFPQPTPPEPPPEPPHHVRDPHARQLSPPYFTSFFLVVAAACRIYFCMQRLIN